MKVPLYVGFMQIGSYFTLNYKQFPVRFPVFQNLSTEAQCCPQSPQASCSVAGCQGKLWGSIKFSLQRKPAINERQ